MKNLLVIPLFIVLLAINTSCGKSSESPDTAPDAARYTVKIEAEEGGTALTINGDYQQGAKIGITATANTDYAFDSWTSSSGGTFGDKSSSQTEFTMPGNSTTITAHFKYIGNSQQKYTLTIESGEGGTIPGGRDLFINGEYLQGAKIPLIARSMPDYAFDYWTSSNGGTFGDKNDSQTEFTMPGRSTTITAHFKYVDPATRKYYLRIETTEGGTVPADQTFNIRRDDYHPGTKISILAIANPGYVFDTWTSVAGGTFGDKNSSQTEFTMPASSTILTAHFKYMGNTQR